jgi:FMN phosphatase YigB (HAD superfamily)
MTIYLFNESCKSTIDFIQEKVRLDMDRSYVIEPDKNLELLMRKEVFLIDVFNTFIQPVVTIEDDMNKERGGMVYFLKTRTPRTGFNEFLEYYHNNNKKIGIHSDEIYKNEFEEIRKTWGFDRYIDKFFDCGYATEIDMFNGFNERNYVKDFNRMIKELDVKKENTLIIGDGLSDILPARAVNVDLLLVPTFKVDQNFDYKDLIPKNNS